MVVVEHLGYFGRARTYCRKTSGRPPVLSIRGVIASTGTAGGLACSTSTDGTIIASSGAP
jgi:hypothetical protein